MVRFTLPRDLYHGKGALEALKTLKGKKAIICVGGGSMKRFGFLQRAEDYLKEAGMEVKLFEGIESDPSVDTVMKGAKVMEEYQPDWIVAIGAVLSVPFLTFLTFLDFFYQFSDSYSILYSLYIKLFLFYLADV